MVTPDVAAAISSDDASPDFPELALWDLIAREAPPSFPLGFTLERLRSFHVAMRTMSYVLPIEEVLHGASNNPLKTKLGTHPIYAAIQLLRV